jgi:hypothetical protein
MTHLLPPIRAKEEMLLEGASIATLLQLAFGLVGRSLPSFLIQIEFPDQGNGGDGGDASSGLAYAHGPGAKAYSGAGGNAAGGDVGRREPDNIRSGTKTLYPRFFPRWKYGPAHPDAGTYSPKGKDEGHHGGLVNVGSGTCIEPNSCPVK